MNAVVQQTLDPNVIASLVINGDLSRLTPQQKVALYSYRCQQVGLDPSAKPFDLLRLSGREVLYANAACTQQLCAVHKLTTTVVSRERVEDAYTVVVRVTGPDGRSTENMGAVPLSGLKGEAYANALMKCQTKAIRRAVLSHVGLGMLDETEVETIPGAQPVALHPDIAAVAADPRGDIASVDTSMRDRHVSAIADILAMDAEENAIADALREYVAEHLQKFQELYIAVADELAAQKVCTKTQLKAWLRVGLNRKD